MTKKPTHLRPQRFRATGEDAREELDLCLDKLRGDVAKLEEQRDKLPAREAARGALTSA
ncbi:hypothetical protein ACFXNW_24835 [Nocardia sp. NPDC059180]|uniref:hypothetical protein n=1 Tax=Nocardia sp. NPDC059180 TaxID=3346761 RepID=UPI0036C6BFD0